MTVTVKPNLLRPQLPLWSLKKDITIYPEVGYGDRRGLHSSQHHRVSHDPGNGLQRLLPDGIRATTRRPGLARQMTSKCLCCCRSLKVAKVWTRTILSDLKEKVEGQLKGRLYAGVCDRKGRKETKAAEVHDSFQHQVSTMEPALRLGDPVWDDWNNGCLLQQMPSWLIYDLVVLEDDKQLFPPYRGAYEKKLFLRNVPIRSCSLLNKLAGKITEARWARWTTKSE